MERARTIRLGAKYIILLIGVALLGCHDNKQPKPQEIKGILPPEPFEFGFNLNEFEVKRDTIRSGDTFGEILQRNNIGYADIFQIAENVRDSFDIRKLQLGKPYTLLCSKDSLQTPQCFIYQPSLTDYVVINFRDSIHAYTSSKPVKHVERELAGEINGSISQMLEDQGISPKLAYILADEIYAWTIDFRRLQKGDKFKVIYTDKYIDDTLYAGIGTVKAAFFDHFKEPYYAFEFTTDSTKNTIDYFSDTGKTLRRPFLKAPVQFSRISSRYNLHRRIALYGNKVRPHKGTDFAAPIGTPIMATASGRVTKSGYTSGNGNYVKINHSSVYDTQYLHMKKRNVSVGQNVKQGDVIGWVGMTGNTSGPHVCYRFWKNGEQVDPFKLKLPESEPIADHLKKRYLEYINPIKKRLENIPYPELPKDSLLMDDQNLISYRK